MGLMLAYKKFKDKYFDFWTDIEFPKSEINEHPEWYKKEYDSYGNVIYYEDSYGYWEKYEYNQWGNIKYYEDSAGKIRNNI